MKKLVTLLLSISMSIAAIGQTVSDRDSLSLPDSLAILQELASELDSVPMVFMDQSVISYEDISDNPLYYKLFMPIVLYRSAVADAITPVESFDKDYDDDLLPLDSVPEVVDMTLARMIDETLVRLYLEHPELVKMTEQELMGVPGIIPISDDLARGIELRPQITSVRRPGKEDLLDFDRKKQRYWKTFGNFQCKYTQSYYSENWYKGGESNHSILGQINLEANYAKKQTTFDNKLELKLGYYTTEINGEKAFRTNDDLIRFTSKYGLKAWESWYYSAQFQGYTQFMPVFDTKVTTKLKSKFFAPAYGNISIGLDYKPKFKNKNITLSVQLSPFSYNCRYVSVDSIATNFGIDQGERFKYTMGSRFDGNIKWKFFEDLTWTCKAQFYSSFESVEANIENTIDYKLSKYLSLQFFCHWRFDDSVKRKNDKEGNLMGYDQFKEFLTLNFNYAW